MKKFFSLSVIFILCRFAADSQGYKLRATLTDYSSPATFLATKPGDEVLIQGCKDGSLILRDGQNGTITKKIQAHSEAVQSFGFNTTNKLLITSSRNGEIRVYDFAREKIINRLAAAEYAGMKFAVFSIADGFIYFSAFNRLYKTRSDLTQIIGKIYEFTDTINAGIITPDRTALIIAVGKFIYVINTRTDEFIQQVYTGESPVEKLFYSPAKKIVAWNSDGTIQSWKFTLGQIEIQSMQWFKAGSPGNVSFSHDGMKMITGNVGNWSRIWIPGERKVVQELFSHQGPVTCFSFSADDSTIYTASEDLTFKIWKSGTDTLVVPTVQVQEIKKEPVPVESPPQAILREEVNNEVKMLPKNIPAQIRDRTVKKTETVTLTHSTIDIFIYDNRFIDGDTLSLYFNGEWILKNYGVLHDKKKITLKLIPNTNNYLVLFAENLGTKPPNTAVVQYFDGKSKRFVTLSSDMSQCSAVNFLYKE